MDVYKERTSVAKILPFKKERFPKIEKNDLPSPTSYDHLGVHKKISPSSISFGIPKGKFDKFTVTEIKKRSKVPPVGAYDITKSDKLITKGVHKSYKWLKNNQAHITIKYKY